MKACSIIFSIISLAMAFNSSAKVIYGNDHRKEVSEATAFQRNISLAAASMISKNDISVLDSRPGFMKLNQRTLAQWLESVADSKKDKRKIFLSPKVIKEIESGANFCEGERFVNQPNPSMCSGFLIAPDLIVTAGHCANLSTFCSEYRWVFDFTYDVEKGSAGTEVSEKNIYSCKKVISNVLSMPLNLDYAVVQLDRRVNDREPVTIRNDLNIDKDSQLFIVGSPSGLPLKVADGAKVRSNHHPSYFSANLDSFQGNSGSGVFNAVTGVAEGILVRGENDFIYNPSKKCIETNKCADDECRGEDVTRITSIPEVGLQKALNDAAKMGNVSDIEKILNLNVWVDFYTKNGKSALFSAVRAQKESAAIALLARGADVNLKDANGETVGHTLAEQLNLKNKNLLTILINAGLNLEIKNNAGETALMVAANSLNSEGVKLLLKNGANKNTTDASGNSILTPFSEAGMTSIVNELNKLGIN